MTESTLTPSPRQGLNRRQAETVEKLLVAGQSELDEVGPDALTIRTVAHSAGVSPATAYTYLASKHHLFAELFWRRLVTDPGPEPTGATATERLQTVTRHMAALLAPLTFAFSGALLQAGMGLVTYDDLSRRLDDVVAVIMEGPR